MKKILVLVLVSLFACSFAYATVVPNRISGGTVAFNSEPKNVTFNSVTTHIKIWNNSVSNTANVVLLVTDNSVTQEIRKLTNTIELPIGLAGNPVVIEMDFATNGFITYNSDKNEGSVSYIVTGELGDL